jgi:anhydro-N-acetylmuramic acid kinase
MYMKGPLNPDSSLKNPFTILGAMSGTSCDGLDLIVVDFELNNHQKITYHIQAAATLPFPEAIAQQLPLLTQLSTPDLLAFDVVLGQWMGQQMQQFLQRPDVKGVMAVASHGHTVFHQPNRGFTLQIGSGAHIHAAVGLPVVCDFRTQDVALGGQGAPLVPIGDQLLFDAYDGCLNLGGFSNVSFENAGARQAIDICAVNVVLNTLAQKLGHPYDSGGAIAATGAVCLPLLEALQQLEFYQRLGPKSLGVEWVAQHITPLLNDYNHLAVKDLLRTYTEHVALQIAASLRKQQLQNVLVTGGGVFNVFLMQRLEVHFGQPIKAADTVLVNFKEALIFALLGYLRLQEKINVLSSVTGSSRNHSAGVIYR